MDAADLARWTRFAARGGIGKGTAVLDCVAERVGDLMFLKVGVGFILPSGLWLIHCLGRRNYRSYAT